MDFFEVSLRVRQAVAYLMDVSYTDTLDAELPEAGGLGIGARSAPHG
jgi:hypothetical protein